MIKISDYTTILPRHEKKNVPTRQAHNINKIVLHTTDSLASPKAVAKYHISPNHISSSGCPSICYHYLVSPYGDYYKCLNDDEYGWHAGNHNKTSVAVAMMYKCSDENGKDVYGPAREHLEHTAALVNYLCEKFVIPVNRIYGHRELEGTGWFWYKGSKRLRKTCPGSSIDMDVFRKMVYDGVCL